MRSCLSSTGRGREYTVPHGKRNKSVASASFRSWAQLGGGKHVSRSFEEDGERVVWALLGKNTYLTGGGILERGGSDGE